MLFSTVAALLIVSPFLQISVTSAKYTEKLQCPAVCNGENPLVNLGVLRCHKYQFEITHRVTSAAHEASRRGLAIRGRAAISGGDDCTYELKLEEVEVFELTSDGRQIAKPTTAAILQKEIAYFGFEDGRVTGFCPSETENPFARNVKAAILSHFQADLKSLKLPSEDVEEDISGHCLTRYEIVERREDGLTFTKRKPTVGCADKFDLITRFDGVSDETASATSKNSMLDGEQECRVTIKYQKPVSEVVCREKIVVNAPVDRQWKHVNTIEVSTKLKLISSKSSGSLNFDASKTFKRSSLRRRENYAASKPDPSATPERIVEMLRSVEAEKEAVNARNFVMLVDYMRQCTDVEFNRLKDFAHNELVLGLLFDAAIHAQTETSVHFLEWCLGRNHLALPVGHMSFLPNPSLAFIQAVQNGVRVDHVALPPWAKDDPREFIRQHRERTLTSTDHKTSTMLTSNLLRTYCKSHPRCEEEKGVKEVLQRLEARVMNGCRYYRPKDMEEVLDSLRGIANLGRVSNKSAVYAAMEQCLRSRPRPDLIVRATAAEAFRRFADDSHADDILLTVVRDTSEDVEVRIHAYRSWARHLTYEKLANLDFLHTEPNEHVKSFILSHLDAVRSSKDPAKRNEALLLALIDGPLTKMIDSVKWNPLKQSFYAEKYYAGSQYGGGINAAVVYGPQSVIPRYVNLNFTLDVSGYSINILELGYHSVYSEKLQSHLRSMREKFPTYWETSGLGALPTADEVMTETDAVENKSRLSVRLFDRDVEYNDDLARPEQWARLLEARPNFVGNNETVAFATVGGMIVQINHLLTVHQDITCHHGGNAKYGVHLVLDAVNSITVGLNTAEGLLGYSTEDHLEVNMPLVFTVDLLDRIRELTGFEVGLLGVESKVIAFKTSRSVRTISPSGEKSVLLSGGVPKLLVNSPSILKTLIGLDATLSSIHDPTTGLTTGYVLAVERFEGLFVSFIKEKPGFSHLFQSVKFEVKRYSVRKSGLLASRELIKFNYLTRAMKGEWFTVATFKTPWNSTYSCSLNYNAEGEFSGDLSIAGWGANLTGNTKQIGPSEYEVAAQLIRPDFSLTLNQQITVGKRYVLAAESTSRLLAFVFKSTTEFDAPTQMKHTSELQLPRMKKAVVLTTQLNWTPRNYAALFDLRVDERGSRKKWVGEAIAINKVGLLHSVVNAPIYNYSMFWTTEGDSSSSKWTVGSSAVLLSNNASSWIVGTQHRLLDYEAAFTLGYVRPDGDAERKVCFLDGEITGKKKLLFRSKGDFDFLGATITKAHFSGILRHPLVCRGKAGSLRVYLDTNNLNNYLEGEALCGGKWTYKVNSSLDLSKRHHTFKLLGSDGFKLRVESPYTIGISKGLNLEIKSSVYVGDEHRYDTSRSLFVSGTAVDDRYFVRRISDGALLVNTTLAIPNFLKFAFHFDLPTVRNGFSLQCNYEVGTLSQKFVKTNFLLMMDSLKRGFEIYASSGPGGYYPLIFNGSSHGLRNNNSAVANLKVLSDPKGFDQASLFVRTLVDDELTFNVMRSCEKEGSVGELSLLCTLNPGQPTQKFTGFLYKSQTSWAFTREIIKVEQQGEWNGNRATPPGMPFRYGIKRTTKANTGGGELHAYAEDTNMGKVFGFEMIEGLYMYQLEDAKKGTFELESHMLLNWRKYLGRGVIGSQATVKARMDKALKDGAVDVMWTLPDDEQTPFVAEAKYERDKNELVVKSKAFVSRSKVHEGKFKVQRRKDEWKVEVKANLNDLVLKALYEGDFVSPTTELELKVVRNTTRLLKVEVVASKRSPPRLHLTYAPLNASHRLKNLDLRLSSQTMLKDMSIGNFDVEGHFKTAPIVADCDFRVETRKDLRLMVTDLEITEASGLKHRERSFFKLSKDASEVAVNFYLDSPYLSGGAIDVSAKHGCDLGVKSDYNYEVKCVRPHNYTLMLKNTKKSKRAYENFITTFTRVPSESASVEMRADNALALRFSSCFRGATSGEVKLSLQMLGEVVGEVEGVGNLVRNKDGFSLRVDSKLTTGKGVVASLKLDLSSMPSLRAIDMSLKSSVGVLGVHHFGLKADAGYLLNLLLNPHNRMEDFTRLKTYLLRVNEHAMALELINLSSCMATVSLPSLPIPVVFRLGYDLERENAWRTLFQIKEPVQVEARTLLSSGNEAFLALSNRVNIFDGAGGLQITHLFNGEKRKFMKGGCRGTSEDCLSILLGGEVDALDQTNLLFSIVLPRSEIISSIAVETEFVGRTPRALYFTSKGREVGFGAWRDYKQKTVTAEIAWNRRRGGLLAVIVGPKFVALQDLENRLDFGQEDRTYYLRGKRLQSGALTKYFEGKFRDGNKVEVDSYLLKEPITLVLSKTSNQTTLTLRRGRGAALSPPVVEFSIYEEALDRQRTRILLTLRRNERSITIETLRDSSVTRQIINSTINVDGKVGQMFYERIPTRRIYLNFNDNVVFAISCEYQPNEVVGVIRLHYREDTVKMVGEFRASTNPMAIFASVRTAQAEAVLYGNASGLLNVEGSLWHNYNDGENILDAELSTKLDERSGIYEVDGYWRDGSLLELLFGGVKSTAAAKIPVFMAEVEENLISLIVEEGSELGDLFNQTALDELWLSTVQYVQTLSMSFGSPSTAGLVAVSNVTQAESAEPVYNHIMGLLDRLNGLVDQWDLSKLRGVAKVARGLQTIETWLRKRVEEGRRVATAYLRMHQMRLQAFVSAISNNFAFLKSLVSDAFGVLKLPYNQLAQNIGELKHLQTAMSKFAAEVEETASGAMKTGERLVEPLFESFKTSFYTPLALLKEMEVNAFAMNSSKITVNSTLFLPLWARTAAGVASARLTGYPLTESDAEKRLSALALVAGELGRASSLLSAAIREFGSPSKYKAWLFLETAGKSRMITLNKQLISFEPNVDAALVLLSDAQKNEFAVIVEFRRNGAHFVYRKGGTNFTAAEWGMTKNEGDGSYTSTTEQVEGSYVTMEQTPIYWRVYDELQNIAITFFRKERSLFFETGLRSQASLEGAFALAPPGEPRDVMTSRWLTSKGRREKWSTKTRSTCEANAMNRATVKELFEDLPTNEEECPRAPFMELAFISKPRCRAESCEFSADSVYAARTALASCLGEAYVRYSCARE